MERRFKTKREAIDHAKETLSEDEYRSFEFLLEELEYMNERDFEYMAKVRAGLGNEGILRELWDLFRFPGVGLDENLSEMGIKILEKLRKIEREDEDE